MRGFLAAHAPRCGGPFSGGSELVCDRLLEVHKRPHGLLIGMIMVSTASLDCAAHGFHGGIHALVFHVGEGEDCVVVTLDAWRFQHDRPALEPDF
jgi:hypothetical protein